MHQKPIHTEPPPSSQAAAFSFSYDYSFTIVSASANNSGFFVSVGFGANFDYGINSDGIMIGMSSNHNGVVSCTHYSWKPSSLWYSLVTIPIRGNVPILAY